MLSKLLQTLFPTANTPLDAYDIPGQAKPRAIAPAGESAKVDEQGFAGAWKDPQHYEAVNVGLAGRKAGTALDGFDLAALAAKLGERWGSSADQAKAQEIKRYWEEGKSAADIARLKQRAKGWSERTIDPYISALYLAKEEREAQKAAKR